MSCRYCTCADCSFDDTGAIRYPIGEASPEEAITIPRDLHELYKEAAEKWALKQMQGLTCCIPYLGTSWHVADCKAARILGLKRGT